MIKHGDILTSHNGKLLPKIICFLTGAKRSHAGIILNVEGQLCFYDASLPGVTLRPLRKYLSKNKNIALYRPEEVPGWLFNKALAYSGRPYGFGDLIVHHFLYQLAEKLGIKWRWTGRGATTGSKSIVCTELVAILFDRPKWWRYTPKMLEEDKFFTEKWSGESEDLLDRL